MRSDSFPHTQECCLEMDTWAWRSHQQDQRGNIASTCIDSKLETTLQCGASSNGLGATLLQQGQPIAYARRAQTVRNNSQETSDLRPKTPSTHVFETSEVWNWDHVQTRQGNVRGRRSVQSSSQETVQRSLYSGYLKISTWWNTSQFHKQ